MAGWSGLQRTAQWLGKRLPPWLDWSLASTWQSWPRYLLWWDWQIFFVEEQSTSTQQQVLRWWNKKHNINSCLCLPSSFFLMSSLAGVSSDWRYFRWSWSIFSHSSVVKLSLIFKLFTVDFTKEKLPQRLASWISCGFLFDHYDISFLLLQIESHCY